MRTDDSNKASFTPSAMAGEFRRVEVITGTARRRNWSAQEKAGILAESAEPGACVSDVARRHGINRGQLFTWRRQAMEVVATAADAPAFVPVAMAPTKEAVSDDPSCIEIEMGGARIRVRGAVNAAALRAVVSAVRGGR